MSRRQVAEDLYTRMVRSEARSARVIRFATVGIATSAGYVIVVAILADLANVRSVFAAAVTYLVFLPINYLGHRRITWNSYMPKRFEIIRFLSVHGFTLLACMVIMAIFTEVMQMSHWAGSMTIVIFAPILNFVMFDLWVFRSS
jgi:putative flippase GtrA